MSTLTQSIPVDDLARQARGARPGHGFATAIAAVFVAIGWTAGRAVTGIAFAGVCVRYGYWRGRGLTDEEIAARGARPQQLPGPPRPSKL